MKLIAHRGNINGSNPSDENKPEYIEEAIKRGFDVEIDIWFLHETKQFFLGHDKPEYFVQSSWLRKYNHKLWVHCKNIDALYKFSSNMKRYNYFWHDKDRYTLTSKNYIWTYPNQEYTSRSVIVMPEIVSIFSNWETEVNIVKNYNCYGICSDYIERFK